MTTDRHTLNKHLKTGLAILLIVLLTACGAKLVRGASPLVNMSELSHQDNNITVQLNIRNLNGVVLDIQNIDFSLSTDDKELLAYTGPVETIVAANGTEAWSVEVAQSNLSRELLGTLENGDINSLPYTLNGSVSTRGDGTLRFKREGHIYPLPGRPGHFR